MIRIVYFPIYMKLYSIHADGFGICINIIIYSSTYKIKFTNELELFKYTKIYRGNLLNRIVSTFIVF